MSNSHYLNSQMPSVNVVNGFNLASNDPVTLKVHAFQVIGQGTFGSIEKANVSVMKSTERDDNGDNTNSNEKFVGAIKKVHQDPRYKNRELTIIQRIRKHPNIVEFRYYYYSIMNSPNKSSGDGGTGLNGMGGSTNQKRRIAGTNSTQTTAASPGDVYLHLVMECMPECLSDLIVRYHRKNSSLSSLNIRIYTLQMLRALGYLHALGICHRDIKTSNMLVDESKLILKLCDFGSAKELVTGANSVSYISSRYYRAPELLFGAQQYTTAIDVWSAGCVLGEMLRMGCLFTGSDTIDQIIKIVRILGSPSASDLRAMNPTSGSSTISTSGLPQVLSCPVRLFFPHSAPTDLLDLLSNMLVYDPSRRPHPLKLLLHKSFDILYNSALPTLPPSGFSLPISENDFLSEELKILTDSEQHILLNRAAHNNNNNSSQ